MDPSPAPPARPMPSHAAPDRAAPDSLHPGAARPAAAPPEATPPDVASAAATRGDAAIGDAPIGDTATADAATGDDALPPIPDFDPVPVTRRRRDGWTPERQRGFIAALAETGLVATAARRVGMGVTSAYQLRRRPGGAGFAAAWDMVLEEARERALSYLVDRTLNGTTRPRFYRGRYVGTIHGYETRAACAVVRAAFATGPVPWARKPK